MGWTVSKQIGIGMSVDCLIKKIREDKGKDDIMRKEWRNG